MKSLLENGLGWSGSIFVANPQGCPKCNGSGYKGRVGVHELLTTSEDLVEAINKEADTTTLKKICRAEGMKTLHQDSLLKVKMGITTMEEALSTISPDL